MAQDQWDIQKYVTPKDTCPFDQWFCRLDSQTQARVDVRLDRVSLGNFGDRKSVGKGVYELRLAFGPGYRVYYAIADKRVVLLLGGGSKASQAKDIKMAQQFWRDYQTELKDQ
ncbi:MAG: type II toxin-antitoxin system RelE/ParE family toxin [Leptolyngbyaceae cyanobacterium]